MLLAALYLALAAPTICQRAATLNTQAEQAAASATSNSTIVEGLLVAQTYERSRSKRAQTVEYIAKHEAEIRVISLKVEQLLRERANLLGHSGCPGLTLED